MSRIRRIDKVTIALTITMLAGLAFVLRPQHTPTTAVAPSTVHIDRPEPPAKTRPLALIISDSYTAGSGLAEMSYGCMAAVKMGWLCRLSTEPGTGYISGGSANRFPLDDIGPSTAFDERLPGLVAMYEPDIVILDGGRNDLFAPPDAIFDAMSATIADVHQTWPAAQIVYIRPRFLDRPDDNLGFDDAFIARLLAQPGAQGMVVVDPISRFTGTQTSDLLSHDRSHPNQRGGVALSSALASLLDLSFASTT